MKAEDCIKKASEYYHCGMFELALETVGKALTLEENNAAGWLNRGVMLERLGRHEEALEAYSKSLAIDDANADAWFNKSITLARLERYADALAAVDRAIDLQSGDAGTWNFKSDILSRLGRDDDAEAARQKALQIASCNGANNRCAIDQTRLVGKYVLIGLTTLDDECVVDQKQIHGYVSRFDEREGIAIKIAHSGKECVFPPDLSSLKLARPGEYRLKTTGEVVIDPDLIATWYVIQNTVTGQF